MLSCTKSQVTRMITWTAVPKNASQRRYTVLQVYMHPSVSIGFFMEVIVKVLNLVWGNRAVRNVTVSSRLPLVQKKNRWCKIGSFFVHIGYNDLIPGMEAAEWPSAMCVCIWYNTSIFLAGNAEWPSYHVRCCAHGTMWEKKGVKHEIFHFLECIIFSPLSLPGVSKSGGLPCRHGGRQNPVSVFRNPDAGNRGKRCGGRGFVPRAYDDRAVRGCHTVVQCHGPVGVLPDLLLGEYLPRASAERCRAEGNGRPLSICGVRRRKEDHKTRLPEYVAWRRSGKLSDAVLSPGSDCQCGLLLSVFHGTGRLKAVVGGASAPAFLCELRYPSAEKCMAASHEGQVRPV